ncbi:release factor glutamine methyltransferase [Siccirubricoccus deserti]|uniref:Release factor glutamine methyltransferase n=1 Tax=Siccirubricoccus deserti TaxID=2013562 RepID=A0A9X0R0G8_9PROT|nr:peptide chain release factor N(5)-glutamine methyltransferase [Siccirubricoccus deserti]MBC4017451.1 peptide chain release factor N(5)-glutamine methyltransferase [Siccirubricoccus deserti]GGC59303.1 release factor glutamine methyltransferase [Siccirubricoccus deserti]
MSSAATRACADPAGTVGFFLCRAGQHLRAAAIETPRLEARLLLAHAMGCRQEALLRDPRAAVPAEAAARFGDLLRRRLAREPVALLLGTQEFWSLPFAVSPATLIPRADSESLIEAALEAFPDRAAVRRVLDLGTGTGCLLLAALSEFPGATGIGIDRVPAAAALARENARRLGLADRAAFLASDWAGSIKARFDLVLCNPPYIETYDIAGLMPEVARYEPVSALDGGADGLAAYRHVVAALPELLAPGGQAVLELGQGQRAAVEVLARAVGLEPRGHRADLGGVERALRIG